MIRFRNAAFGVAAIVAMVQLWGCRTDQQPPAPAQAAKELVVATWGGDLQKNMRVAFFEPFEKSKTAVVRDATFTGEYGKIKAQVQAGRVEWDVVEVEEDTMLTGGKEGLLEPIDYNIVPGDAYFPQAKSKYGVGVLSSSTALTWNKNRIPAGTPAPSSWRDFWDLKRYPGKRGLYKSPLSTLEIALLADGVQASKLYPLDVDRALRKLTQIKRNIVWWSSGSEFQQKILSEYTMSSAWNGRAWSLQQQGKPVGLSFNQGVLQMDWWVVPKGSSQKQLAMELIAQCAKPEGQHVLAQKMAYGPVNREAAASLPAKTSDMVPTSPANLSKQIALNAKWWSENNKAVRAKWEAWLLQ